MNRRALLATGGAAVAAAAGCLSTVAGPVRAESSRSTLHDAAVPYVGALLAPVSDPFAARIAAVGDRPFTDAAVDGGFSNPLAAADDEVVLLVESRAPFPERHLATLSALTEEPRWTGLSTAAVSLSATPAETVTRADVGGADVVVATTLVRLTASRTPSRVRVDLVDERGRLARATAER